MKKTTAKSKTKTPSLADLNITLCNIDDENHKWESTSLSGYIFTDYKKIKKLFGMPNSVGDTYKVDAEWEFDMNGKRMTIYNYKDGKNYNGASGLPKTKITEWHIGSGDDVTEEIKILTKALEGRSKMM